jgi:hypothetical protein
MRGGVRHALAHIGDPIIGVGCVPERRYANYRDAANCFAPPIALTEPVTNLPFVLDR